MDVRKMMNLFIVLFLLLNGLLYYINQQNNQEEYVLTGERFDQLAAIYEKNGFSVNPMPEVDYRPRAKLIIRGADGGRYENDLRKTMLHGEWTTPQLGDSHIHQTIDGNETLTFDMGDDIGRIYYQALKPHYVPQTYTENAYNMLVGRFIGDMTLGNNAFEKTGERRRDDAIYYYYNERYKDELLFCNEVVVKLVAEQGITEATSIRYEPYGFETELRGLKPMDEVLYNFMYHMLDKGEGPIVVTHVTIGYHLGSDDRNDLISLAIEPHYQIKLSNGQDYYINAYTNTIVE